LKRAQETLGREISPIDDMRSTAIYRRRVAQNLLGEFFDLMNT
jgi:xanthine dehydrogenase iron-sulfur cluster and FAD-binding subunit A